MLVNETRSLLELFGKKEPIWIVNNTKKPASMVALDFGQTIKFPAVPPGPDPICISERIPYKALEESFDFRQAVSSNLIKVITADSAQEYFAVNKDRKLAIEEKLASLMNNDKSGVVTEQDGQGAVTARAVDARDLLNPKVLSLHNAFKERNINERQLLEELLSIQDDMSENELEYIRSLDSMATKRFVMEVTKKRHQEIVDNAVKEKRVEQPKEKRPKREIKDNTEAEDFFNDDK